MVNPESERPERKPIDRFKGMFHLPDPDTDADGPTVKWLNTDERIEASYKNLGD